MFNLSPLMIWSPPSEPDPAEDVEEALAVDFVDPCIERNGESHHTGKFELMNRRIIDGSQSVLVVRRGQPFELKVHCKRPLDEERDVISLMLAVQPMQGERVSHGHGTVIYLPLLKAEEDANEDEFGWKAVLTKVVDNVLTLNITTSVHASISRWEISIDTKLVGNDQSMKFISPIPFYLLFNPWCEKDPVFLDDEQLREEYVLSDTTLVWRGCDRSFHPTIWKLGQYERDILDCGLLLLSSVGRVSATYRGNPVRVARALSAAINSNDDNGALVGYWGTDFSDGTAPTAWVGSVDILQQYYRTRRSVRYGQCWVFSGVLATVARAFGIPCRVVSNFNSAHDSEASLTIDYYFGENDNHLREFSSDSTWNFHVWNELWMRRADLGASAEELYDGWQAVDATPQELSDGMYKLGPAPVKAVKRGEINVLYDCDFVFAEVNADEIYWRYRGSGRALKLIRKDPLRIGKFISTKAVGAWEREDITESYKFGERSCDERITMMKALKQTNNPFARLYANDEFHDVDFEVEIRNDVKIGEPFTILLKMNNHSDENTHPIEGIVHVDTILYTGKFRKPLKAMPFNTVLDPNSSGVQELHVEFDEYFSNVLDQAYFKIICSASVEGTNYEYFAQEDYRLRKPDIKIALDNEPICKRPLYVTATLSNPMPIPLTNGVFRFECSGAWQPIEVPCSYIEANGATDVRFRIMLYFEGNAQIAAKFNAAELNDVDGFLAFEVSKNDENSLGGSLKDMLVFA
ncbi:annulin-like [Toxorhynchites rutilus septentrionalis]|uniref:annulin-like n=1 Tax=Toxorhynchites rutilus septentrionalis TaxID=329112 RepID=UPI00247956D2|nr:annulin-like [Toxorhynchites rutilus septentrionalis]XP_055638669.1 annulin-like [Toxorhynchites rutilus septentrionalis]